MPPPLAKGVLVVEQAEFLDYVIHYKIGVNCWLTSNVFLVRFAQLNHHVNSETLVRIELKHAIHDATQLWRILLLVHWRKLPFSNTLEKIIQRKVLFVVLTKGTSQHTQFICNATHAPHITFPIVSLALQYLWTHVEWSADSGECLKCLRAELSAQTQITYLQVVISVYKDVCRF